MNFLTERAGRSARKLRAIFTRRRSVRIKSLMIPVISAVIILSFILFCVSVRRRAGSAAAFAAQVVAEGRIRESIVNSVRDELTEKDIGWEDFCIRITDESGDLAAVTADTVKISDICAGVIGRITDDLGKECRIGVKVPIGSVIAPELLSGRGYGISVCAVCYPSVSASVSGGISEAGINQVLHTINMEVSADVRMLCMSESCGFTVRVSIPVAQSVIVGRIPVGVFS